MCRTLSIKLQIRDICKKLSTYNIQLDNSQDDINPSTFSNLEVLFSKLDIFSREVSVENANLIVSDSEIKELIPTIRWMRAIYEYNVEKKRSIETLSHNNTKIIIKRITAEYDGSSILETPFKNILKARTSHRESLLKCLVVGLGPLPITALMLQNTHNLEITCLDLSEDSCRLSENIFATIENIRFVNHIVSDIFHWTDFSPYDVIFVNGMVCSSTFGLRERDKLRILKHLEYNITHSCLIALRSGYALSQLFYPQIYPRMPNCPNYKMIPPSKLGRTSLVLHDL